MEGSLRPRYSRNIALPQIGHDGQEALLAAKILIIGAGGLGSPVALYLAAAGIGTIGIIDNDHVELSNLQRQILFGTSCLGKTKVTAAANRITDLNCDINVTTYKKRLTEKNAADIIEKYDLIADCSDNFTSRFIIADTCFTLKKPLISGAVTGFTGQLATFKPYLENLPCYRCLCPAPPIENLLPNCINGGVLGSVAGTIGSMQATELIKEILNIGTSLAGHVIVYNGLSNHTKKLRLDKDPTCPNHKNCASHNIPLDSN